MVADVTGFHLSCTSSSFSPSCTFQHSGGLAKPALKAATNKSGSWSIATLGSTPICITYTKQEHQTHYLQGKRFSINYTIFYQWTHNILDILRCEERERAGRHWELNPGHLTHAASALPLSYKKTTTSPYKPLYVLHRWHWNASVTQLAATQHVPSELH